MVAERKDAVVEQIGRRAEPRLYLAIEDIDHSIKTKTQSRLKTCALLAIAQWIFEEPGPDMYIAIALLASRRE